MSIIVTSPLLRPQSPTHSVGDISQCAISSSTVSRNTIPDHYDYVDLEAISPHLFCSICQNPAVAPIVHGCGNLFCRRCIDKWAKPCPLCRLPMVDTACCDAAMPIAALLGELMVRCPNCLHTMAREKLAWHLSQQCSARPPCAEGCCQCKTRSCALSGSLREIADDSTTEPFRILTEGSIVCPAAEFECAWRGHRADLETHTKECPRFAVLPILRCYSDRCMALEIQCRSLLQELEQMKSQHRAAFVNRQQLQAAQGHTTDVQNQRLEVRQAAENLRRTGQYTVPEPYIVELYRAHKHRCNII